MRCVCGKSLCVRLCDVFVCNVCVRCCAMRIGHVVVWKRFLSVCDVFAECVCAMRMWIVFVRCVCAMCLCDENVDCVCER